MIVGPVATRLGDSAIIKDGVAERIYFTRVPQNEGYPLLQINQISGRSLDELGPPEDDATTIQIDVWAEDTPQDGGQSSYDFLKAMGDEIRKLLEGVSWEIGGFSVQSATLERDNFTAVPRTQGSTDWLRRRSMDFRLLHTNNVARS
ncbi:MAG: DUF3168 domain-containing protein [Planctomycetota bacterium]